jgi:large subunit ribosomal protein L29
MKNFEIRDLPDEELRKRIKDEEENMVHLRFQKATSQLESPIKIRTVRRDIAKMKTVLRYRELQKANTTIQSTSTIGETKEH